MDEQSQTEQREKVYSKKHSVPEICKKEIKNRKKNLIKHICNSYLR